MPQLPAATLSSPIRSEVHDTLRSVTEQPTATEVIATSSPSNKEDKKEDSPAAGSPYDVVKELVRRRKRRKAKEQERQKRKVPPEAPS